MKTCKDCEHKPDNNLENNANCETSTVPTNVTPLIYTHFPYEKCETLRKKLEHIFNEEGIDSEFGISDFLLAEMVTNFLMTIYNTKTKTEEGF